MRHTLNRVQEVASANIKVTADIQHIFPLGNDSYRAIVSLSSASAVTEEQFNEAVGSAVGYRAKTVASTAVKVSDFGNIYSCFLTANTPSKPYSEAANFQLMAANLFIDGEKNLWKVVGEGDQRRLIQTSNDNLDEILKSRLSRRVITASYNSGTEVATGDYALFFNSRIQEVDAGFVVGTEDGLAVFSRKTEQLEPITAKNVIEAAVGSDIEAVNQPFEPKYQETAIAKEGLDKYLSYMKRLYSGTEFFKKLEEEISERHNMGKDGFKNV